MKSLYSAIGLALVLVAWSFASPVGSSADELSHLQRIYCYTDQDACPTNVNPAKIPAQLVIGISNCWKIPRFQIVSKWLRGLNTELWLQNEDYAKNLLPRVERSST